jgi:hypothetical protein
MFQPVAHYYPGDGSNTKRDNSYQQVLSYPGKGDLLLTGHPAKSAAGKNPTGVEADR